jgi:hypothetical protein
MGRDPEVDAWFEALEHPRKDVMLGVRSAMLAADRRVNECIKWKSPTFTYEGNIASIDPKSKAHVLLMFHQGAKLPGRHPMLEGSGSTARYMRFVDNDDVRKKRAALRAAVAAWIEWRSKRPSR